MDNSHIKYYLLLIARDRGLTLRERRTFMNDFLSGIKPIAPA
jgi:hypothetical protein